MSPPLYSLNLENLSHLLVEENDSCEGIFDGISEDTIEGKSKFLGNDPFSSKETSVERDVLMRKVFELSDDFAVTETLDDDVFFGSDVISTDDISISDAKSALAETDTTPGNGPNVSSGPKVGSEKDQGKATPRTQNSRANRDGNGEAVAPSVSCPGPVSTTDFAFASFADLMQPQSATDKICTDPAASLDAFANRFQSLSHRHDIILSPTSQRRQSCSQSAAAETKVLGSTVRPVQAVGLLKSVGLSTGRLLQHESIYGSHKSSGKVQATRPSLSQWSCEGVGRSTALFVGLQQGQGATDELGNFHPFRSSTSKELSSGKEMMECPSPATFRPEREACDCLTLRLVTGDSHCLLVDGDVVISGGVRLRYRDTDSTSGSVRAMEAFAEELMKRHPPASTGETCGCTKITSNVSSGSEGKCNAAVGRSKSGDSGTKAPASVFPAALSNGPAAPAPFIQSYSPSPSEWSSAANTQLQSGAIKRTRPWDHGGQESIGGPLKRERLTQVAPPRPPSRKCSRSQLMPMLGKDGIGEEGTEPVKRLLAPTATVAVTSGSCEHFHRAMMTVPQHFVPTPHSQVDLSLFFSPMELDDVVALVNDMEGGGSTSSDWPPDRVTLSPMSTKRKAGQISGRRTNPSQMYIHQQSQIYPPPSAGTSSSGAWFSDTHTSTSRLPPNGDLDGMGHALYLSSGAPPTCKPGGTLSTAMNYLPGIPPSINRSHTVVAPSAAEAAVRRAHQEVAARTKFHPQSPEQIETLPDPPGWLDYLSVGSGMRKLQTPALAKESVERKTQVIAGADEMVLQMNSTSSASTSLLTDSSSFLPTTNTLIGNHLLSASAYPVGSSPSNPMVGASMFKLQGLVGLKSVLNSSSLPPGRVNEGDGDVGLTDGMLSE